MDRRDFEGEFGCANYCAQWVPSVDIIIESRSRKFIAQKLQEDCYHRHLNHALNLTHTQDGNGRKIWKKISVLPHWTVYADCPH